MNRSVGARQPGVSGKVLRFLHGLVSWALTLLTAVMSLIILIQVLCRMIFGTAIIWAEELAVLLFAWVIFVGAAYAHKDDIHLSINTLRLVVGRRVGIAMDVLRVVIVIICSLVAIWQGIIIIQQTSFLRYPAMGIPRSFLYASVPVGFFLGLIYLAVNIVTRLKKETE
jgi:TRAP-type C4-dicarboxylate transport system permease small subunit